MSIPTTPLYHESGMPVYWLDGANTAPRRVRGDVRLIVIHHSAGTDSRRYLQKNDRGVSCHYLVGRYGGAVQIWKYASEEKTQTFTQGYGSIGGYAGNVNEVAVGIEIEGPPFDPEVLRYAAALTRTVVARWPAALVCRHRDLDTRKVDPSFDWHAFCRGVYG